MLGRIRTRRPTPRRSHRMDCAGRFDARGNRRAARSFTGRHARVHFTMSQTGASASRGLVRTGLWQGWQPMNDDDVQEWLDALAGRDAAATPTGREARALRTALQATAM